MICHFIDCVFIIHNKPWGALIPSHGSITTPEGHCQSPHIGCHGVKPLHMLACLGKYDLKLCCSMYEKYHRALSTRDKWGKTPLDHFLFIKAPKEILAYFL